VAMQRPAFTTPSSADAKVSPPAVAQGLDAACTDGYGNGMISSGRRCVWSNLWPAYRRQTTDVSAERRARVREYDALIRPLLVLGPQASARVRGDAGTTTWMMQPPYLGRLYGNVIQPSDGAQAQGPCFSESRPLDYSSRPLLLCLAETRPLPACFSEEAYRSTRYEPLYSKVRNWKVQCLFGHLGGRSCLVVVPNSRRAARPKSYC
jgi:hypothetical protein